MEEIVIKTTSLRELIQHSEFFARRSISIAPSIYKDDPFHFCFLVIDENTKEQFKVRTLSDFNKLSVLNEYKALKLIATSTCSDMVPKILYANLDGKDSMAYSVQNFIEGISIDKLSPDHLCGFEDRIASQLFEFLQGIYKISGKKFGDLANPAFDSYFDLLFAKLTENIHKNLGMESLSVSIANRIYAKVDQCDDLFKNIKPVLLHFDLKPANLIFNRNENQLYMIDFEKARFGHIWHDQQLAQKKFKKMPYFYDHIYSPVFKELKAQQPENHCAFTDIYDLYNHVGELAYLAIIKDFRQVKLVNQKILSLLDRI